MHKKLTYWTIKHKIIIRTQIIISAHALMLINVKGIKQKKKRHISFHVSHMNTNRASMLFIRQQLD